jgi:hypothetical protein
MTAKRSKDRCKDCVFCARWVTTPEQWPGTRACGRHGGVVKAVYPTTGWCSDFQPREIPARAPDPPAPVPPSDENGVPNGPLPEYTGRHYDHAVKDAER